MHLSRHLRPTQGEKDPLAGEGVDEGRRVPDQNSPVIRGARRVVAETADTLQWPDGRGVLDPLPDLWEGHAQALLKIRLPPPRHLPGLGHGDDDVDVARPPRPAGCADAAAGIGTVTRQVHGDSRFGGSVASVVMRHERDPLEARDGPHDGHLAGQKRVRPVCADSHTGAELAFCPLAIQARCTANADPIAQDAADVHALDHARPGGFRRVPQDFVGDGARAGQRVSPPLNARDR